MRRTLPLVSAVLAALALPHGFAADSDPQLAALESKVAAAGLKPEPADLVALSDAYARVSRPLEAASTLERALAAAPQGGAAAVQRRRLGRLWEAAGRFDAAVLAYKAAAVAGDPAGAEAQADAARAVQWWLDDRRRAAAEWLALAKGWPTSPLARAAVVNAIALARDDEGRAVREEAEDIALARFAGDPALVDAVASAAGRLADRKQGDAALAAVQKLPPGQRRTEAEAELLRRSGKPAEGATVLENRYAATKDAPLLRWAADMAQQSGDRARAAKLALRALTEQPFHDRFWETLDRAFENDVSASAAALDQLAKAWSARRDLSAQLLLQRARAAAGTERARFAIEAVKLECGALNIDRLADVARDQASVRAALAERAKGGTDRGAVVARYATALAENGEAGPKALAPAIRDQGLADGEMARWMTDRLCDRLGEIKADDAVVALVREMCTGPLPGDVRNRLINGVKERLKDRKAKDALAAALAAVAANGEHPVVRAYQRKGEDQGRALAALVAEPPPGLTPFHLAGMRWTAVDRLWDTRDARADAVSLAGRIAGETRDPAWIRRWAEMVVESRERADKAQVEAALAAVAGQTGEAEARLTAQLALQAGRAAEAAKALAALPADAAGWDRRTREAAVVAYAAVDDRAGYQRVLDGAVASGDRGHVWQLVVEGWTRAPDAWRRPLAERAAAGTTDARAKTSLLLHAARLARDAGDGAGSAALIAQAKEAAADNAAARSEVAAWDLDAALRRRDDAAADAAAKALLATPDGMHGDQRWAAELLRKWLEPRLAQLPAEQAVAALDALLALGHEPAVWAGGQLAERLRAGDPVRAAQALHRTVRRVWREDRDGFERLLALPQAEAAAGRAGIAAGLYAHMAGWFSPERIGADKIDLVRRLGAEQLAKTGGAGAVIDDRDPKAPLLRAAALLSAGDEDEAWRTLRDHQKLLSDQLAAVPAELALLAARRLAGEGRTDQARSLVEAVLRAHKEERGGEEGLAQGRLLLGDLAFREEDFPGATLEFQQVVATWPKTRAALLAQLRLGDCLAAARQLDGARKIYEQFGEHEDKETRIRAHVRLALLELGAGNKAKALELFREVAAMNPPRTMANELYLDWGRALMTANRLQEAEEVLTMVGLAHGEDPIAPGEPLRITLRDPFLQTSQSRTAVPVLVKTASGDEEIVEMTLSAEAKGVFTARIGTALGAPAKGDRVLQVRGDDTITYDYTDDFKRGRRVVAIGSGQIPIAADAQLKAASTPEAVRFAGEDDGKAGGLENLGFKPDPEEEAIRRSASRAFRTGDQLKPGNLVYLAVADADRDVSPGPDRIPVILQSAAGDRVQVDLVETGDHTGLFRAEVKTGLRPADLAVSDSAPGSDPMAMLAQPGTPDHDQAAKAWIAAGDRKAGKTVVLDLKQVAQVDRVRWSRGAGATDRRITRYRLAFSGDGLAWTPLFESGRPVAMTGSLRWTARPAARGGAVRSARAAQEALGRLDLAPREGQDRKERIPLAKSAGWTLADGQESLAEGRILVPTAGRYEFAVRGGGRCWVMVGGRIVVDKDRDEADPAGEPRFRGGVELAYGTAALRILANSESGLKGGELLWRKPGDKEFAPVPAIAIDGDAAAKDVAAFLGGEPAAAKALDGRHGAEIACKPFAARFVRMTIDAWEDGDAPAIASIEVGSGKERLLPAPGVDYAALAGNAVLELSAGDEVTASYRDEKNKRKAAEILRARLRATYFDARIEALEPRTTVVDGKLVEELFPRYRFRAGDTVAVRVTDYDADTTNQPDKVAVRITSSAGTVSLDAIETGPATGVFQAEVKTRPAGGAAGDGLPVQAGEMLQLSYLDLANVQPGGPTTRSAVLREVVASQGRIALVPTTAVAEPKPGAAPYASGQPAADVAVVLAPLQIQVTDPDQLISAGSRARVRLTTARGASVDVLLAPNGDAEGGMFAGSVALALGSPADGTLRVLPPAVERGSATPAEKPDTAGASPVLPVVGGEAITVRYLEGVDRRTEAAAIEAAAQAGPTATAKLVTAGRLLATEDDFQTPLTGLHVAGKLGLLVIDPDADTGDGRDTVAIAVATESGDTLTVTLGETEAHSGVFTGSTPLVQGSAAPADQDLQVRLGDRITAQYREGGGTGPEVSLPVAKGHDAQVSVFAKRYEDDRFAARTQLRLAESWFEIYKRQRQDLKALERAKGKAEDIAQLKTAITEALGEGTSLLQRTIADDPDGVEADQVLFLLGNFEQESGTWDSAIDRYRSLLGQFPDSPRAPEAQYKIAQCHEEQKRFDDAWEAYVRLAYRWPEHELVADAMARIGLFYDDRGRSLARAAKEAWQKANPEADPERAPAPPAEAVAEFNQAAAVYGKLIERFPDHRIADQILLAQGNSLYQAARHLDAQKVFDGYITRFPQGAGMSKALYWAGSSALEAGDPRGAFLRYGRLTQDFPDSVEAKYARGRLATDKRLAGVTFTGEK